ncbi:hypothetical protein DRP04_05935 [Archaeoglobales archaeon]|nr:MAG: hypothetical protein DRP04_05935 [Archaeoglobales archaeon]
MDAKNKKNMETVEDILLDLAWRRFSEVWQDRRYIDNKARTILAANGILLGLVINALNSLNPVISLTASLFLFASIILCVSALKLRIFKTFGIKETWIDLKEERIDDPKQLKLRLYGALAVKEEYNAKQLETAAKHLMSAIWLFLVGAFIIFIGIILFFISFIFDLFY